MLIQTRRLSLFLIALCSLSLAACGGKGLLPQNEAAQRSHVELRPVDISRSELLAQIDAWQAPETVAVQAAEDLRSALRAMVEAGPDRYISKAPSGAANAINDLQLTDDGSANRVLRWTYSNRGDYDLNGEANISDITALGINLGKSSSDPGWDSARQADGDRNGEINVSDITPLGANLFSQVASYRVLGAETAGDPLLEIGLAVFDAGDPATNGGYSFAVTQANLQLFAVEPLDASGNAGVRSNLAAGGIVLTSIPGNANDLVNINVPDIPVPDPDPAHYELDNRPDGAGILTSRTRLLVEFNSQATVAAANALLQQINGSIVGALADISLFVIEIPDSADFAALDAALALLEQSGLVEAQSEDVILGPFSVDSPTDVTNIGISNSTTNYPTGQSPNPWLWNFPPSHGAGTSGVDGNWAMEAVRAPQTWNVVDYARRGSAVPVTFVVDGGFHDLAGDGSCAHPDLTNIRLYQKSSQSISSFLPGATALAHGQHVAGTVGALFHNGGVCGINPLAERTPQDSTQQFFGVTMRTVNYPLWDFVAGYKASISGAIADLRDILAARQLPVPDVMNFSLGYNWNPNYGFDANTNATCQNIARAQGRWVRKLALKRPETLIVCAAGNDSDNMGPTWSELDTQWASPFTFAGAGPDLPGYPVSPNVLVVESICADIENETDPTAAWRYFKSDFSNVGGHVAAPGERIMSTVGATVADGSLYPHEDYETFDGTSMASPLVAGLAGFLLNVEPTLSVAELRLLLSGDLYTLPSVRAATEAPLPSGVPGPSRRVDAFAALTGIDGLRGNKNVQKALADVDDGSADGNQRRDAVTGQVIATVATPDGRRGDGRITMRDFRAFRDAYLQINGAELPDGIMLDGPATHFKKDLNFDGTVGQLAVSPVHPVDIQAAAHPLSAPSEGTYPRYDLNGDGEVAHWNVTSPYRAALDQPRPVNTDYVFQSAPGLLRDIDVLATAGWELGDPQGENTYYENVSVDPADEGRDLENGGWEPASYLLQNLDGDTLAPDALREMPDYLHSCDLHLRFNYAEIDEGVTGFEVKVSSEIWPDNKDNNGKDGKDEPYEVTFDRTATFERSNTSTIVLSMPIWTGNVKVSWKGLGTSSPAGERELTGLKPGQDRKATIPGHWEISPTPNRPTDFVMANGLPSVLTMRNEEDGFYLEFHQAENALGTSWKPPVLVSVMAPGFSELVGMVVVQDHPCVLSLSVSNESFFGTYSLRWQRANDVDGQSWPSPSVMISGDWINLDDIDQYWGLTGLQLENIGDGVGICGTRHYDSGENGFLHQLLYRASHDGINWSAPEQVETDGIAHAHAMGDVGGRPGIAFMIDTDSTNLWFTCSNSFDGAGWSNPSSVTVIANALGIVNAGGVPAVLTKSQYGPAIRYVRAMDANGSAWDNPYSLKGDTGASYGSASLSIIGGRPAVSLMGNDGKEAWYIRALDPKGDNWPEQHEIVVDELSSIAVRKLLSNNGEPAFLWTSGILGTVAVYE